MMKSQNNVKTVDFSKKILSLPMHPFLKEDEIDYICESINKFQL